MKKKTLVVSIVCILSILCSSLIACDKHVHQFEKDWAYDEEYHWHIAACEHEEEISGKAPHDYRENGICKICQHKKSDGSSEEIELPTMEFSSELLRDEVPELVESNITVDGLDYAILPNGTYELVGVQAGVSDLVVPEMVNGRYVTSMVEMLFLENTTLRTVTLNDKITVLRRGVFADCFNLTSITGLASVETIESYVFQGCEKLTQIELPEGLKVIELCAFYGCTGLTEMIVPSTVEEIGQCAFYNCTGIESVELPDSLVYLSNAFMGCSSLTEIVIPDSVKAIDLQAMFYGCSKIESITIPFLGLDRDYSYPVGYLFALDLDPENPSACNLSVPASLKSVTVTDCTQLSDYAFSGLSHLESVVINDEVAHVGNSAFTGCTGLEYTVDKNGNYVGNEANPYMILASVVDKTVNSFTINNSTKHIAGSAFAGCIELESLSIPNSIESVGANAFADCAKLSFYNKNGARYLGNSNNQFYILVRCTTPSTLFSFEPETKIIAGGAFKGCVNIQSITIPDNITSIGGETFKGCTKLSNLVIPATIKAIAPTAFVGCMGLVSITAPSAVLNSIATTNESTEFLTSLKTVNIVSGEYITTGAFYKATALEKVTLVDTITRIYEHAFDGCKALKQINLPDSIERIDDNAFYECENLAQPKMPENLKRIGTSAFFHCYAFDKQLILPEGLEYIGDSAFEYTDITDLYIGANLKSFAPRSFGLWRKLNNVMVSADNDTYYSVGNCIIEIGTGILRVGTNTSVLPYGEGNPVVTAIGDTAFYGRMDMLSINIPKSVTSFGENVFFSCAYLGEIYYEGTLEEWEAITKPTSWKKEVATAYEKQEFIIHCSDGDKTEQGSMQTTLG